MFPMSFRLTNSSNWQWLRNRNQWLWRHVHQRIGLNFKYKHLRSMRRNLHRRRKQFQLVRWFGWRFILVLEQLRLLGHQHSIMWRFLSHWRMLHCMVGQHLILKHMVDKPNSKHRKFTYMTKHSSNNHLNIRNFLCRMKRGFMEIKQR